MIRCSVSSHHDDEPRGQTLRTPKPRVGSPAVKPCARTRRRPPKFTQMKSTTKLSRFLIDHRPSTVILRSWIGIDRQYRPYSRRYRPYSEVGESLSTVDIDSDRSTGRLKSNRPMTTPVQLRVEFLLKTDSGYPRDAEVTLFTLTNPEHSLRFNTHWSAPPVSALSGARSGGPRKMSQPPVSRKVEHRETYGQAQGRSGGHQRSSVNRRCQLSFVGRLWLRRSSLPQGDWYYYYNLPFENRLARPKFGCGVPDDRVQEPYRGRARFFQKLTFYIVIRPKFMFLMQNLKGSPMP